MEQEHENTADVDQPNADTNKLQLGCLGLIIVLAIAGFFIWKWINNDNSSSSVYQNTPNISQTKQKPNTIKLEVLAWNWKEEYGYAKVEGMVTVSYTHLTLPTNREV